MEGTMDTEVKDTTTDVVKGQILTYSFTNIDTIEKSAHGKDKPRRYIKGLANANTVDRIGDRVDPGAFVKAKDAFMKLPMVFYNHDWSTPIGKVVEYIPSEKGLEVEIELGYDFEPAETVWKMIQQGLLKAFSIGFRPKTIEHDVENDIYNITDLELMEVSVVTIPMNTESLFEVTKDGNLKSITLPDEKGQWVTYKDFIKGLEDTKKPIEEPADQVVSCTYISKNAVECTVCGTENICIVDSVNKYSKEIPICSKCFVSKYEATFTKGWVEASSLHTERTKSNEAIEEVTTKLGEALDCIKSLNKKIKSLEEKVLDTTVELSNYKIAADAANTLSDLTKYLENLVVED